ncbi:MAG: DUF1906 domain-containing protein [Bacillota bacterium]|nr:DUF1906 domain-containing protein [Bacillota bacterium]
MNGIDCTNTITENIGKALKDSGYQFVCRYLAPAKFSWKRLIPSEVDVLTKYGIKIISVFETTADRAKYGASIGSIDGKDAKAEAEIVNQPKGSCIYFAVDYDADSKDYDSIEAYLKAAAIELQGYKIGVYGSFDVIEEMANRKACSNFWQTYAWSKGQLSKYANIYQMKNGVLVAGINCDINVSYGNEGGWNYMPKLTWKEILQKHSSNAAEWEVAIDAAVNAANAAGNIGVLEIFKYLPDLIEKIYSEK